MDSKSVSSFASRRGGQHDTVSNACKECRQCRRRTRHCAADWRKLQEPEHLGDPWELTRKAGEPIVKLERDTQQDKVRACPASVHYPVWEVPGVEFQAYQLGALGGCLRVLQHWQHQLGS